MNTVIVLLKDVVKILTPVFGFRIFIMFLQLAVSPTNSANKYALSSIFFCPNASNNKSVRLSEEKNTGGGGEE